MIQILNTAVDNIHGAKTQFVKTFVPNQEIAKQLQTYVDAQASFAKKVGQETFNFFTTLGTAAYTFDAKKAFATK